MSFLSNTTTDLINILAADGEALTYLDRDGANGKSFTTVMHRNGDDGSAVINIPVASVANPKFADKITDGDSVVWYISEAYETSQGRTYCELKQSTWWQTVTIETMTNGVWGTLTANVLAMITANSALEDYDEYNNTTTEYEIKMQYMATPAEKMRLKWGSVYIYITGITPDPTYSRYITANGSEVEA